ncbi:lipid A deacylase LpxR family protein [uncultured Polaribacter sp.]|uniref:lipid A deacylase LpxR family protein n=1 Tax=uncultured Polaribacter sp. TaxID=174711 RepID=UPI002631A9FD|nr:lipid A deacylase LpxR family protein [uncultured Polaribacter sp.]
MKVVLFIIALLLTSCFVAQEKYSQEVGFITDNDLYVSTQRDRYYSSGVFLSYRYLSKKKQQHLEKLSYEWKLGHEIYTPIRPTVETIDLHDRPFAGHLYGSFGINRVFKNNKIINTSLQLGFLGPKAFGEQIQNFIHNIYGFRRATGWKYQIKSALSLNINAQYIKTITSTETNMFDLTWTNSGSVGTVFSNMSSGILGRIGLKPLQNIKNSIAFNSHLNNNNTTFFREVESFMFFKPSLQYVFYDATLQGSFLNKNSVVTKEIKPIVFNIELGILFTANRFNLGYSYIYNSKRSEGLRSRNGHKYGRITVNYLLD